MKKKYVVSFLDYKGKKYNKIILAYDKSDAILKGIARSKVGERKFSARLFK